MRLYQLGRFYGDYRRFRLGRFCIRPLGRWHGGNYFLTAKEIISLWAFGRNLNCRGIGLTPELPRLIGESPRIDMRSCGQTIFPQFPGSLLPRCYKSCVSISEPRKVHIAEVSKTRNGVTYTSVHLRRTFREDEKVKHETLGNLSDLPRELIELMGQRLAQNEPLSDIGEKLTIQRSQPYGNVKAVLMTLHNIGMVQLIASRPCRERYLVNALIADRVISPGSKLSCSRGMKRRRLRTRLPRNCVLAMAMSFTTL